MYVGGFSERVFASYPNSDLVNLKFCVSIDCSTKITQNAVSFIHNDLKLKLGFDSRIAK